MRGLWDVRVGLGPTPILQAYVAWENRARESCTAACAKFENSNSTFDQEPYANKRLRWRLPFMDTVWKERGELK